MTATATVTLSPDAVRDVRAIASEWLVELAAQIHGACGTELLDKLPQIAALGSTISCLQDPGSPFSPDKHLSAGHVALLREAAVQMAAMWEDIAEESVMVRHAEAGDEDARTTRAFSHRRAAEARRALKHLEALSCPS